MKLKIVSTLVLLSMGVSIGVGAAELTLKDQRDNLEMLRSNSIEHFWNDTEQELDLAKQSQTRKEIQRMDNVTSDYLTKRLQEKKQQLLQKQQDSITQQTDKYISELEKEIDNQLNSVQ